MSDPPHTCQQFYTIDIRNLFILDFNFIKLTVTSWFTLLKKCLSFSPGFCLNAGIGLKSFFIPGNLISNLQRITKLWFSKKVTIKKLRNNYNYPICLVESKRSLVGGPLGSFFWLPWFLASSLNFEISFNLLGISCSSRNLGAELTWKPKHYFIIFTRY